MVKIHMEKGHAEIMFEGGEPLRVGVEIASAIGAIYRVMKNSSEDDAAVFRTVMKVAMADDSHAWTADHDMTIITVENGK